MALDRVNGEVLGGLNASMHIVVESRRLAELSNLVTDYLEQKPFGVVTKQRPVFDDAVAKAVDAFAAAGALLPIRFDEDSVLVQAYPKDLKIAVIFQRSIAGKEHYATSYYDLPPPLLDSLLAGKKPREH